MADRAIKAKQSPRTKSISRIILVIVIGLVFFPYFFGLVNYLVDQKGAIDFISVPSLINEMRLAELFYVVATGALLYYFLIFIISLFILPIDYSGTSNQKSVDNVRQQIQKSFIYMLDFIRGCPGPVVKVEKGIEITHKPEKRKGASIALIDSSSAAVFLPVKHPQIKNKKKENIGKEESVSLVVGPGVNFIEPGNKLYGTVDLRPQYKLDKISGLTLDGVEITTELYVIFSLSPPGEKLVLIDGNRAQYIEIRDSDLAIPSRKVIAPSSKILDDGIESILVDQYEKNLPFARTQSKFSDLPTLKANTIPFQANTRCIEAAVLSYQETTEAIRDWKEIPTQVAQRIFQECLAKYRFDDLFGILNSQQCFIKHFRTIFRSQMISQGVQPIRIVYPTSSPTLRVGDVISMDEVRLSSPIYLGLDPGFDNPTNELAKRGITIIDAGFTDLLPNQNMQETIVKTLHERWSLEYQNVMSETEKGIKVRAKKMRLDAMFPEVSTLFKQHDEHSLSEKEKVRKLIGELIPVTDRLFKAGLFSLKEAKEIMAAITKLSGRI